MKRIFFSILTISLVCAHATSALATAHEIVIEDSAGAARGSATVGGLGRVKFVVANPSGSSADGTVVTLTNTVTGKVITETVKDGTAAFSCSVTPGVWSASSSNPAVAFTQVSVLSDCVAIAATGVGVTTGTLLGVGGVAVGGTALGFGIHAATNGSSHHSELSPSS